MGRGRTSSRSRALSLGDARHKLVDKFNKAYPQPSRFTRIADRIVESFAAFASKWERPETPVSETAGVETRSTRRVIGGFVVAAILYPYFGRIDRAPVFFAAAATASFLSYAWILWHRSHPPIKEADTRFKGVLSAFLQGAAAFALVLLLHLALKYSLANPEVSDFRALIASSGAGVFVYQRRTGMTQEDPEIWVIVAVVAFVFSGLWTLAALFFGKT